MDGAPIYRLSNAIIDDDYGDTSGAFEENWVTWNQIENWQIAKSDVFFSFAPREAAAYLLPRFMIFTLDEIESKLNEYSGLAASDCATEYIKLLEKRKYDYKGINFNETQIKVLKQFLSYVQEKEGW